MPVDNQKAQTQMIVLINWMNDCIIILFIWSCAWPKVKLFIHFLHLIIFLLHNLLLHSQRFRVPTTECCRFFSFRFIFVHFRYHLIVWYNVLKVKKVNTSWLRSHVGASTSACILVLSSHNSGKREKLCIILKVKKSQQIFKTCASMWLCT